MKRTYLDIVTAYEGYLERHGDSYLGVGWTKRQEDADTRYRMMLGVLRSSSSEPVSLLDFGCGASHLYEYMQKHPFSHVTYSGLDLSDSFLNLSRRKHPEVRYYKIDVREDPDALPEFDYIVMNGVFTARFNVEREDLLEHFKSVVATVFRQARVGIAFNVMSKQVDWERDDLFHLSFDELADLLARDVSRHFVIRHDYGLYEYTTYVYKKPSLA